MIPIALVIALVALGGNFFVLYEDSSSINQNKTSLTNQIVALQSSVSGLQSTVNTLKTQLAQSQASETSQGQQIAAAQTSLQGLQTQLTNLLTELSSNATNDHAFQAIVLSQLRSMNSTLAALSLKVASMTSSAPLSTLVILSEAYDSSSATFNFVVLNNLNVTVYAQLHAQLYGQGSYPCDGDAGYYDSQVYEFPPNVNTTTHLVLSQGIYKGCGASPINSVWLEYLSSQSVAVSQAYTFAVVPPYSFAS